MCTFFLFVTGMLNAKSAHVSMNSNIPLHDDEPESVDSQSYTCLVWKLLVAVTKLDLALIIGKFIQFMDKPKKLHWDVALMPDSLKVPNIFS